MTVINLCLAAAVVYVYRRAGLVAAIYTVGCYAVAYSAMVDGTRGNWFMATVYAAVAAGGFAVVWRSWDRRARRRST